MKLQLLADAVESGLRVGALVHERSGSSCRIEVVTVDDETLLGLATPEEGGRKLFVRDAQVHLELPQGGSIVFVPGRIADARPASAGLEVEVVCPNGAETRPRRADARVSAECRLRFHDGASWEETRSLNLSAGGLLVANGFGAHAGDFVDLELELDGKPIRCQAEVLRRGVKSGGMSSRVNAALRFVGLPEAERQRIALFVLSVQAKEKAEARARH